MKEKEIIIGKNKIKFIFNEEYLNINYLDIYTKIIKKEIKNITIYKDKKILNKIFININGGTKIEFIFFSERINSDDVCCFFEEFKI